MAGRKPKNPEDRKRYTGKSISEFCQKVRERRIQLGVTQAELAARTGYSRKQISELEGGAFPTSEERILALCSALETTPDYLFGFIPPATKRLGQGVLMDDITHDKLDALFNKLSSKEKTLFRVFERYIAYLDAKNEMRLLDCMAIFAKSLDADSSGMCEKRDAFARIVEQSEKQLHDGLDLAIAELNSRVL